MTLEILEAAEKYLYEGNHSLKIWRTVWRMFICFFCFLRYDDIKRLKVIHNYLRLIYINKTLAILQTSDLTHHEDEGQGPFCRLHLKYGKTNQLNQPDHRTISSSDRLCAYSLTRSYLDKLTLPCGNAVSLQPSCHPADPNKPHPTREVPYTRALSDLKEFVTQLGYDGDAFSEHSHKRGAATESSSQGISENQIQEQGGWTNIKTTRLYIDKKPNKNHAFIKKLLRRKTIKRKTA